MQELQRLLLQIRSEANALKKISEKTFKSRCLKLSKLIAQSLEVWSKAQKSIADPEQMYIGEVLCALWCDVLETSTMVSCGEHLRKCDWELTQNYVSMTGAALHGLGKGYKHKWARDQAVNLCESLVLCCDQTRRKLANSKSKQYPPPDFKPLHEAVLPPAPDYSQRQTTQGFGIRLVAENGHRVN